MDPLDWSVSIGRFDEDHLFLALMICASFCRNIKVTTPPASPLQPLQLGGCRHTVKSWTRNIPSQSTRKTPRFFAGLRHTVSRAGARPHENVLLAVLRLNSKPLPLLDATTICVKPRDDGNIHASSTRHDQDIRDCFQTLLLSYHISTARLHESHKAVNETWMVKDCQRNNLNSI